MYFLVGMAAACADAAWVSPCRIGGGAKEQTLAGRDADSAAAGRPYVLEGGALSPHFISDCFFLTQRAVHSCLIPAGNRLIFCLTNYTGCSPLFTMPCPHGCASEGSTPSHLQVTEASHHKCLPHTENIW